MQTILVVDDTKTNIDILVDLLDEYDIITSLNGEEAIESVNREDIDLILLDIMMPNMDGYEVCKKLKSSQRTKNIPIIFLTAKSEQSDIEKGFKLGAVDYLIKPFYPSELKARVKTHLELRGYQKNLEKKVEEEVEKNRQKEQLLFQKSKQAEIGELLMHISHQWKQPLTEIGSLNMHNTAQIKLAQKIDPQEFLQSFDKISDILKFMSSTMESFQNFYKPKFKNEYFNISTAVNNALNIVGATFEEFNISITIEQKNKSQAYGNMNEYVNVILTILNNTKDIALIKEVSEPKVSITIDVLKNGKSLVEIKDNCGGIEFDNINDVFLPFISQKNGVGIGLYLAKNICIKNGGDITVQNSDGGALFTITL